MTARASLTLIVKNEAPTLGRCLASVRDILDEIIVVDTGSSDNTREIAGQHGAKVFDFPWCDSFAAARNEAIRHASGQWIFWLDGDEHLDDANRDRLRKLIANLKADNTAYVMKCLCLPDPTSCSGTVVGHVRLFRNQSAIRWEYRIHEQILPSLSRAGHTVLFADITITHTGYQNPAQRHKKLDRNLRLLHLDLAESPNDPFTLLYLGWTYADLGRFADAIPLLQRSLQNAQNDDCITPRLYSVLTQCHLHLGQFDQAWAVCQVSYVHCPDDAELLFLRGHLCRQRGDRAGARACWMKMLESRCLTGQTLISPPVDGVFSSDSAGLRGPSARHHLAALDREEGQLAAAEKHWRTILDDTPQFHPARLGLAEIYLREERWLELESLLAELKPHAPLDLAVLQVRMHLARQDFAAARQLLEDTLHRAPQFLPAHIILSHVLLQSGDELAAEPQLRRIIEMDPRRGDSWRNLIVLYRLQYRLSEAIDAAKKGCWHCPHDADLLLLQGALLQEGGAWSSAESCLLRVIEMGGSDGPARQRRATSRHRLATMYRRLGRVREAVAYWRALLAECPDFSVARRYLEECGAAQSLVS